jgi:hypothetical protein
VHPNVWAYTAANLPTFREQNQVDFYANRNDPAKKTETKLQ